MSDKPVLHYFNGRGRAELIRLTLCAAGIQFEEVSYSEREPYLKFLKDYPEVIYEQVPMLEKDGKKLIQTPAILRYLGRTCGFYGDSDDEAYRIDMLWEGSNDFYTPYLTMKWGEEVEAKHREILETKSFPRYLPLFDKALADNKTGFLVGNKLTMADLGLLECLLATKDYYPERLEPYKDIQAFLDKMSSIPNIARYLKDVRKPVNDDNYVSEVKRGLGWTKIHFI